MKLLSYLFIIPPILMMSGCKTGFGSVVDIDSDEQFAYETGHNVQTVEQIRSLLINSPDEELVINLPTELIIAYNQHIAVNRSNVVFRCQADLIDNLGSGRGTTSAPGQFVDNERLIGVGCAIRKRGSGAYRTSRHIYLYPNSSLVLQRVELYTEGSSGAGGVHISSSSNFRMFGGGVNGVGTSTHVPFSFNGPAASGDFSNVRLRRAARGIAITMSIPVLGAVSVHNWIDER